MMADKKQPTKKAKSIFQSQRELKEKQKEYHQTMVSIGRDGHRRWREIKAIKGFKTDQMVAEFLLDR